MHPAATNPPTAPTSALSPAQPSDPTPLAPAPSHPTSDISQSRSGDPHPTSFSFLDRQRLKVWFDYDLCLPDLAEQLNSTVYELALWADQPHIRTFLDQIQRIARQRTQTLFAEAQHAAVARMVEIVRHGHNEETMRRAADRILRPSSRLGDPRDSTDHVLTQQRFHQRTTVSIHQSLPDPQPPDSLPAEGRSLGIRLGGSQSRRGDAGVGLAEIPEPPTTRPQSPSQNAPRPIARPSSDVRRTSVAIPTTTPPSPTPNVIAAPPRPDPTDAPEPSAPLERRNPQSSPATKLPITPRQTYPNKPTLRLIQQSGKPPHAAHNHPQTPRYATLKITHPSRAPP